MIGLQKQTKTIKRVSQFAWKCFQRNKRLHEWLWESKLQRWALYFWRQIFPSWILYTNASHITSFTEPVGSSSWHSLTEMSLLAFAFTTFKWNQVKSLLQPSVKLLTIPQTVSNRPGWRSFKKPIDAYVDPLDFCRSNSREWDSSSIQACLLINYIWRKSFSLVSSLEVGSFYRWLPFWQFCVVFLKSSSWVKTDTYDSFAFQLELTIKPFGILLTVLYSKHVVNVGCNKSFKIFVFYFWLYRKQKGLEKVLGFSQKKSCTRLIPDFVSRNPKFKIFERENRERNWGGRNL